MRYKIFM